MSERPIDIYLGVPYSHESRDVRWRRWQLVSIACGQLMAKGFTVYSPITMCHPVSEMVNLPQDWDYWEGSCRAFLSICKRLVVLMIPGWQESTGVAAEVRIAREAGVPVLYVTPESIEELGDLDYAY